MEPLKNKFNNDLIFKIQKLIKANDSSFIHIKFKKEIINKLDSLEMKDRVKLISHQLNECLPNRYLQNIKVLKKILRNKDPHGLEGFEVWPIAQYVEDYGLEYPKQSLAFLKQITGVFTAEFSIRPFIHTNEELVFSTLEKWKYDKSEHVRRLVSEGTRPNLPWGSKLEVINNNLDRNLGLVLSLVNDPSPYVRKSVANHLNDISKLNIDLFFKSIESIKDSDEKTKWVIRHASRTLLKNGNLKALKVHGYSLRETFTGTLKINKLRVKENEKFELKVELNSKNSKSKKILIEYKVYFVKKNGISPKIFRFKDTKMNKDLTLTKNIAIKNVTVRKNYTGEHKIEILVNGNIIARNKIILI